MANDQPKVPDAAVEGVKAKQMQMRADFLEWQERSGG